MNIDITVPDPVLARVGRGDRHGLVGENEPIHILINNAGGDDPARAAGDRGRLRAAVRHQREREAFRPCAATFPDAKGGGFYGTKGPGHLGGSPSEQKLNGTGSTDDAKRIWDASEELTGVRHQDDWNCFPSAA